MKTRKATLGEEIFNAITHGVGALISIALLVLLIIKANTALEIVSVSIFGASAIILYTMSTLFHSFTPGTTKNVFQRFDHISIYLLIAGSYTPFCLLLLDEKVGIILVVFQWVLAIVGIVFKSIWIKKFQLIHIFIFLLMGWIVIIFVKTLYINMPFEGFLLLICGGISYSIGVIFYVFPLFKFHHAIWHFFVMFGTIFHFFTILFYVL